MSRVQLFHFLSSHTRLCPLHTAPPRAAPHLQRHLFLTLTRCGGTQVKYKWGNIHYILEVSDFSLWRFAIIGRVWSFFLINGSPFFLQFYTMGVYLFLQGEGGRTKFNYYGWLEFTSCFGDFLLSSYAGDFKGLGLFGFQSFGWSLKLILYKCRWGGLVFNQSSHF